MIVVPVRATAAELMAVMLEDPSAAWIAVPETAGRDPDGPNRCAGVPVVRSALISATSSLTRCWISAALIAAAWSMETGRDRRRPRGGAWAWITPRKARGRR